MKLAGRLYEILDQVIALAEELEAINEESRAVGTDV